MSRVWLWRATIFFTLAIFALHTGRAATRRSPLYDDAYNASVAKNVALGLGYVSSYHEIVPFDSQVSVGPLVILPAALAIRLFGFALWAPMIALLTLNLVLLWVSYLPLRRLLGAEASRATYLSLLFLILLVVDAGDSGPYGYWFEVLGEVPGGLSAMIGALVVASIDPEMPIEKGPLCLGFLLLGLSLLAKTYYCIATVWLLIDFSIRLLRSSSRRRWVTLALALGAFLAPILLWSSWKLLSLPATARGPQLKSDLSFLWTGGSGLAEVWNSHGQLLWPRRDKLRFLAFRVAPFAAVGLALWRSRRQRGASTPLLIAALLHISWLAVIARPDDLDRHLVPALFFAIPGVVLSIATMTGNKRAWIVLVACAVAWMKLPLVGSPPKSPSTDQTARLMALRDTTAYLERLTAPGDVLLVGYGWWANRDLEYALPTAGNFHDLSRLSLGDYPNRRRVLVRSEFWNWEHDPTLTALAKRCDEFSLLHRSGPFTVCALPDG